MVNTSWNVQGVWTEPGARFDLRFEYIDQDQPMAGRRKVGVGGNFAYLSPGASYVLTEKLQVYGFPQLPLYQYVNGVQLTADWAVVAGLSTRF